MDYLNSCYETPSKYLASESSPRAAVERLLASLGR